MGCLDCEETGKDSRYQSQRWLKVSKNQFHWKMLKLLQIVALKADYLRELWSSHRLNKLLT